MATEEKVIKPERERHVLNEREGFDPIVPLPRATVQRLVDESAQEPIGEGRIA